MNPLACGRSKLQQHIKPNDTSFTLTPNSTQNTINTQMRARDTTHSKQQMRANTCKQAHAAAQAETVLSQRLHRKCFSTSHFLRSTSYVVETLHVAPFKLRLHVVVTHLWFQVSVRGATRRSPLPEVDKRRHPQIPATVPKINLPVLLKPVRIHTTMVRSSNSQFSKACTNLSVSGRVPDLHPERVPPA